MHIIHIASELTPIAKVGGLGDVVGGLSHSLSNLNHKVEIILPKYKTLDTNSLQTFHPVKKKFCIPNTTVEFSIVQGKLNHVEVTLIEFAAPLDFFEKDHVYGYSNDQERFLCFCKAAIELLRSRKEKADVIHLHDWPVAILALLVKEELKIPTVFTIHNLQHQGLCSLEELKKIGLKEPFPEAFFDTNKPNIINLLRIGLEYSTAITTVSPTYEKEILKPEGGCGMQEVLKKRASSLFGILNGIDHEYYNPLKDPHLYKLYPSSAYHDGSILIESKQKNKDFFFEKANKPKSKAFTLAAITRLAHQKAPELIIYALRKTLEHKGRFILLGSLHGNEYASLFESLQKEYENHPDVLIYLNKSDALAHRIYASADALIIPSLFEPCGLTQMIAMRYGTVPLVRKTGGLADTVFDVDSCEGGNGFTFDFHDSAGIDWVINRALKLYNSQPKKWEELALRCLNTDNSWEKASKKYENLYQSFNALLT